MQRFATSTKNKRVKSSILSLLEQETRKSPTYELITYELDVLLLNFE